MTPTVKPHTLEICIGAVLGAGAGLALASMPLVLLHTPLPSLWPHAIEALPTWQRLVGALMDGTMLGGAFLGGWYASHQEAEQHVRGVLYLPRPDEALAALQQQERDRMSAAQRAGKIRGLAIGGLELARQTEVGHGLLVAQPNSGKTVVLADALDHALARGDKVLLHDPKSELIETHYRPDGSVVILGPWDARAALMRSRSCCWSAARASSGRGK